MHSQAMKEETIQENTTVSKPRLTWFRRLTARIDVQGIAAVLLVFLLTRVMVLGVLYFSMALIPFEESDEHWRYNPRNLIADGLIRADSGSYIFIADHGYEAPLEGETPLDDRFHIPIPDEYNRRLVAFFPLYPLLIRLTGALTGNLVTAGIWVSNLSLLIALFYLYALVKQEYDDRTAGRTIFYLAAAPSAFFFSAVYTESTFLLFIAAGFYYARNRRWLLAGLAGALASATRPQGVLLAVFILLEAIWQQGFRFFPKPWSLKAQWETLKADARLLPRAWRGYLAAILSTLGLLAYMGFLYFKFGDPLWFLHVQSEWGREVGVNWLPTFVKHTINIARWSGNAFSGEIFEISLLMDTLFAIALLPLVFLAVIRFRPSFGLFALLSYLLPLTSGSALSMQRFALGLVPVYLLLALWGRKAWLDRVIVGVSLTLQGLFLVFFSHWYWAG